MGVFGEKHTSLTREQKRQLIHQADTHKLRPTEVCDWVQATWGLRIARVTVYSILHKQRASLMAGVNGLSSSSTSVIPGADSKSTSSSSTHAAASDECLQRNKESGRVNKYRASPNKNKNKAKDGGSTTAGKSSASGADKAAPRKTAGKRDRSCSVMSDRSSSSSADGAGEGTRWEGQLKRVREPASVELDRAMVEFLKSPASVDSQGRRLNDAELQSHALRLAQSIPSASRMRCSFGWLRHFKRRLGVQWVADRLGRNRWVVEMDHQQQQQQPSSSTTATPASGSVQEHEEPEIKTEDQQGAEGILEAIQNRMGQSKSASSVASTPLDTESRAGQKATSQRKKARTSLDLTRNVDDASILSIQPALSQHQQPQQQQHSPESILNSYPNLFGNMSSLHTVSSAALSMGTIAPLATTLDPNRLTTSTVPAPSAFGMSVDGKMRKVPTKEEAYDMLQSLLMYYEQDHSYIGEQQTLLLPRWIHQQRQIMHQTQENESQMMWMRQQQQQQQQQQFQQQQSFSLFPYQSYGVSPSPTDMHAYHRHHSSFSSSISSHPSLSPPALSPLSPGSPLSPMSPHSPNMSPFSLGLNDDTPMNNPFMAAKAADTIFSSPMTGLGHQTLSGHHPFSFASLHAS